MILETVLLFLAVILLLVVSHELGHFFVAKWLGIRVDEFGVGLPPRLFGIKRGETLYSLNLLPFGGFVRIFGEEADIKDPRSFSTQSFWTKTLIVAAGVIANVFVGFLIFSFLAWFGTPQFAVEINSISHTSPAETAGFHAGDIIVGLEGQEKIPISVEEVQKYISLSKGKDASFTVRRGSQKLTIHATPRTQIPPGEGALGVVIAPKGIEAKRVPIWKAPWEGLKTTITALVALVVGFGFFIGQLFSQGNVPGEILGPVGIAGVARESFIVGLNFFLELIALLSLNLAVINILPIPALDGGRILFFIIEKIIRRSVPARVAGAIHSLFFMLLITFLLWVTYHDILRLI